MGLKAQYVVLGIKHGKCQVNTLSTVFSLGLNYIYFFSLGGVGVQTTVLGGGHY